MKESLIRVKTSLIISLFVLSATLSAQSGIIKINSEVKNVTYYLDDVLKGTDLSIIKDVPAGSYYLKATKNNSIIYTGLVKVTPDEISFVTIKDELQAGNQQERSTYNSKRLDVLMNDKYITNPIVTNPSLKKSFNGYSSVLNSNNLKSYYNKDWLISQGGNKKLDSIQFATLINDTAKLNPYKRSVEYCRLHPGGKWHLDGGTLGIGLSLTAAGILCYYLTFKNCPASTLFSDNAPDGYILLFSLGTTLNIFGTVGTIFGFIGNKTPKNYPKEIQYTLEDAALKANNYNQGIKTNLNLPADYEPDKFYQDSLLIVFKNNYQKENHSQGLTEEQRKYVVQANAMNDNKDYQGAIEQYNKMLELNPYSYPAAYFNLALLDAQIGHYDEAIFNMKKYLALEPDANDARAAQDKIYEWEMKQ